jgi:uncharacterized membrane protein
MTLTPSRISDKQARNILWMILIAALALRLPGLSYSFYGDEWFSLVRDSQRLITDTEDRFRPLFFSLLYLWKQIGFSNEFGLRLLPLIFGLLQIPLAYSIGHQLRGRDYGLLFAALIAVSPILIEFSQELRMYSMVACLALLQVWLMLYLIRFSSWSGWLSFILVALVGVYTHIFYWLFLMGLSMSLMRVRPAIPLWKSFASMMTVVLLYLPNITNLIQFTERRGADYAVDLPSALPKLFAAFTVGFNYFSLPDLGAVRDVGMQTLQDNWLILIPVMAVILLSFWGFYRSHNRENRSASLWLGHELFTIPVLIAVFASIATGKYFLHPKYMVFSAPFLLLLLIESARAFKSIRIRWSIAGLGIIVLLIAYVHFLRPDAYGRKENWREAASFLTKHATEDKSILVFNHQYLLLYYNPDIERKLLKITAPEKPDAMYSTEMEALRSTVSGKKNIFYIYWDTAQNYFDPHNHLLTALNKLVGEHALYSLNPRFKIYMWTLPPPTKDLD